MKSRYSVEEWKNPPSGLLRIIDTQSSTQSDVVGYAEGPDQSGGWHVWFYDVDWDGKKDFEFTSSKEAFEAIGKLS